MTTRIYQGRITAACFEDASVTDNPYQALADTHRLFQDAVNYHIVALAGMADDNDHVTVGGRFRQQVKGIWDDYPKGNPQATTLAQSVCRTLNLKNATFEEAVADIFDGCEQPEVLPFTLQFILDKTAKGEGVIQQQGRELLPKLSNHDFKGNFDFSAKGKDAAGGLKRLRELCSQEEAPQEAYEALAKEMDLSWAGIKTQTGKYWTTEETAEQIAEAVQGICQMLASNSDAAWNKLEPAISQEDVQNIAATMQPDCTRVLAKNAKAVLILKYAAVFFMYYPGRISARLLAAKLPKASKEKEKETDIPLDYTSLPGDPIEMTRGARGYVYPGFSALPNWEAADGRMYEKEWDILAFKEALKAIHGFELKTTERDKERKKLQDRLDYLLGESDKIEQDAEESELPAVLGGDPRFSLLCELVEEMKQTEDEEEYFISYRARKCSEDIFKAWRAMPQDCSEAELRRIVREIQGKKGHDFGSQPLFERLALAKYRPIWLTDVFRDNKPRSYDILRDFSYYQGLKRDITKLSEPVRLTAAEATYSPRALTYSDLANLGNVKKACRFIKHEDGGMIVGVVVRNAKGRWEGHELRLNFSAPRMVRDNLGTDAAAWPDEKGKFASADNLTAWLQPLQKVLNIEHPLYLQKSPAVTLAQGGCDSRGNRVFYLNFPSTLDMTPLHEALGKTARWQGQFLGVQEEKLHLHWPSTYKGKNEPWWKNSAIAESGFTVLGVDLGVRYAAAWSLIQAETNAERIGAKGQNIPGRFLGATDEQQWYGYVAKQGILRLPGEGHQNEVQGVRRATDAEKQEYSSLVRIIKNTEEAIPEDITILRLNDKAGRLFHGLLSRYRGYLQFCYRLFDANQADQTMVDMKAYFTYNEVTRKYIPQMTTALESNDLDSVSKLILAETQRLRALLPRLAERVTTLLLPRKHGKWTWIPQEREHYIGSGVMEIVETPTTPSERNETKIYAMGGLSMARLSQLEDWRKQLQSLNRLLCTTPGMQPRNGRETRFAKVIDPCPVLLEKIDNIREQRVNQIAHGIVAQALGLRLVTPSRPGKNQNGLDIIHGEYEVIPNRRPVDFVVMENLSRYLMREERSRDENSTLMRWAHRQIVSKIKQLLEEVFGIPVLFTHAAYTSKFDSLSSAVGFRADTFTLNDTERESIEKELEPPLYAAYKAILKGLEDEDTPRGFHLYRPSPHNSGEYFISEDSDGIHLRNADCNAATNIAWRGLASPEALHLLHRVRMTKTKKGAEPRRENTREKAIPKAQFIANACPDDAQERFTAFFAPHETMPSVGSLMGHNLVYSKMLWGKLKAQKWSICHKLNLRLLRKAGFDTSLLEQAIQNSCDDDIPL